MKLKLAPETQVWLETQVNAGVFNSVEAGRLSYLLNHRNTNTTFTANNTPDSTCQKSSGFCSINGVGRR